jgi:hypothetical protein
VEAAVSHVRLCRALKEAGFHIDIYFVTVETPFTRQLYEIYGEFLKKAIVLKEHLPTQNDTIKMAVSMVPLNNYDSVIISRIDIIYKTLLINSVNKKFRTVQFIAPSWYNDCVTPMGAPKMNDMFYIFPRFSFDILETLQEMGVYCEDILDTICLDSDEYDCISELFFEPDSEKDMNPYYRIANRPESTTFHSEGKVFPRDFPPSAIV